MSTGGAWPIAEPNDPRRCQAHQGNGEQCRYLSKEGGKYCPRHSPAAENLSAKKAANMYRLQQYQERVVDFTTDAEVKNLRAEIGICRVVLEETINTCRGDANKLVCYSGKIGDLIVKIQKLIQACHRLDVSMGQLLDRDRVILIGNRIVEIVSEKVKPEDLEEIGEQIIMAIYEIASPR